MAALAISPLQAVEYSPRRHNRKEVILCLTINRGPPQP